MSEFYDKLLAYKKESKVYVIAEVGSNWKEISDCANAISLAKNCGADAVKFQSFSEKDLYGTGNNDLNLPLNIIALLKEKADAVGIDFLCTVFEPSRVKDVDPYVLAHKIASCEMADIRLLEAAVKSEKPTIVSTAAYTISDIARTIDFLKANRKEEIAVMHCNLAYPARYVDLPKFKQIAELTEKYGTLLGFSDHTTSVDAVAEFMKESNITVYEKHFNPMDYTDTPDAEHSLSTDQFKAFVAILRGSTPELTEENEARLKVLRRLIATQDIKKGELLVEEKNFGIFRSRVNDANGASPFALGLVSGKSANRDIAMGEGISVGDVK